MQMSFYYASAPLAMKPTALWPHNLRRIVASKKAQSNEVFIDTEVDPETRRVLDYGAVRSDGAMLHTSRREEFLAFVEPCPVVVGHNILDHDLTFTKLRGSHLFIDTLYLSPLLFPSRPYHRLLKDDKLQSDEFNNPANDAIKARDLFHDEVAAWHSLPPQRQTILSALLTGKAEFSGFLSFVDASSSRPDTTHLATSIAQEFNGKICGQSDLKQMIGSAPVELAYALAIIGAADETSLTPAWVLYRFPQVANLINRLCNTPCGRCSYCHRRLDAHQGLREFFGYEEFRLFDGQPMQQQAVEAAIGGQSLLCIFPTGGGKSLTFQLPALMAGRNCHGLTVVISPLQSLMKDQVDNLAERGISDAVTINGLLDPLERASAIEQVADGRASLLYIAPEMLRNRTIEHLLLKRNIVRVVIDEAHCFSAWGQDFRPDYLYIADFLRSLQEQKRQPDTIAVSCFTATAKPKVISDIRDYFRTRLGLELSLFAANAERKNLRYAVIHVDTDDDKYHHLRLLILGKQCPTIVYVSRTRRTREIAVHLTADGFRALPFNGKMDSAEKIANQDAFMNGNAQVIVATSAFGMGVDKKDVGLVIHYDISDSLESYVQEAGRAGRDPNMQADCYVLFADSDLDKHFLLLNQTKLSISEIQQVWAAIKKLSPKQPSLSCSPLEIARQAGWNEETTDSETRVKAAIASLENAGFITRGHNTPHIFATGITVANMDQAHQRLALSPLFDDPTRQEAIRIMGSLISRRATVRVNADSESRIDYLADILGLPTKNVIHCINLMQQEGILADSRDMQAYITRSTTHRELDRLLRLEHFLLRHLSPYDSDLNYKQLNEDAQREGLTNSTVKHLKTLLYFLSLKGYLKKEEHAFNGSLSIHLLSDPDTIHRRFEQRASLCRFIVDSLTAQRTDSSPTLVHFSLVELLNRYNAQLSLLSPATTTDIEEALLYLSKTHLLPLEGGFLVAYNTMQLHIQTDRRSRYTKEHYRLLDEFYRHRIQQIHIVGEYANMMVRDYQAALQYVSDYFQLDFKAFIARYFKGNRSSQISKNITQAKYQKIFGDLSPRQLEIIADKSSPIIVVAAGPGSGKTRLLVHKLASLLLLEDVKHEQLLMLTFSRAAATEFKLRLLQLVGKAAHFVSIKTFHSYAFDLLGLQGSLEESDSAVARAAAMIENGEVEETQIAKSVLVIDEAQDMSADDFRLVRALMSRNEDMRLIAVGDDDQNIYAFRGSDSAHLRSLLDLPGATFYEMTDNYRSDRAIVAFANSFALRIPSRMKHTPIQSVSQAEGTVDRPPIDHLLHLAQPTSSTAILTRTNEQSLLLAHLLQQQGIHCTLLQSTSGFRFINLAEVRYFLKHLDAPGHTIARTLWESAKARTLSRYATSDLLPAMQHFWHTYESTHSTLYRSDLRLFLLESDAEDFLTPDRTTLFIGTIHKAKGREFDTVHLLADQPPHPTPHDLRTLYVGLTRARHNLHLYSSPSLPTTDIAISLTLRDVHLHFSQNLKPQILALRSGTPLRYSNGFLFTPDGTRITHLSKAMRQRLDHLQHEGYTPTQATASYILAWRPRDEQEEIAICLADLCLHKAPPPPQP